MKKRISHWVARLGGTRPSHLSSMVVAAHAPAAAPAPMPALEPAYNDASADGEARPPELLTRPDGPCPLAHHIRNQCAILADGTFYVLATKIIDHEVRDAARVAELTCAKKLPNGKVGAPIPCDRKKLNELYGTAAVASIQNRTEIFRLYQDILHRAASNRATEIQIGYFRGVGTVRMVVANSLSRPIEEFKLTGAEGAHLFTIAFHQGDRGDSAEDPDIDQERTIVDPKKLESLGLAGIRMQFVKISGGRHLNLRPMYSRLPVSGIGLAPLRLTARIEEKMYEIMNYNEGVVTVSGPTGSGKTVFGETFWTTSSDTWNDTKFIVVINDPPESENPKLTNIEVRSGENGGGFDRARKTLLRINPDQTGVGEARDFQSAKSAFDIGRTSKICMVTQHTSRALNVPKRYLDFGLPIGDVLDSSLQLAWTGQRLIPLLCPHCSISAEAADHNRRLRAIHRRLKDLVGDEADTYRARGPGCTACNGDGPTKIPVPGLTGERRLVLELVQPDDELCGLLGNGRGMDARKYWLEDMAGFESMELQAFPYLQSGQIGFDTFVNAFSDLSILKFDLELAGILEHGQIRRSMTVAAE